MSNLGTESNNEAEEQAAKDAWRSEISDANRPVVVYAPQDNGVWLVEPHADESDEYEVMFPVFTWSLTENHKLEDAARSYLAKLFPTLRDANITFKTFEVRYPGVVYVVCLDVPVDFDKSKLLKVDGGYAGIRWFALKDIRKLGEAGMSRENEWQADLFKQLHE